MAGPLRGDRDAVRWLLLPVRDRASDLPADLLENRILGGERDCPLGLYFEHRLAGACRAVEY